MLFKIDEAKVRERINKSNFELGKHAEGFTRRHFISSIFTFSLLGLARPFLESDKVYAEGEHSEYLFVNGWLIRNDDYEKIKDVNRS